MSGKAPKGPVIFFGTGDFSVPLLRALVSSGEKVSLVVTQPDRPKGRGRKLAPTPVGEAAEALNLKIAKPEKVNAEEFLETLRGLKPQFIALADYGKMLKSDLLSIPALGAVNLHPSLLPRWRGPSPVVYTLLEGDRTAGASIMMMDEGMDSGPLVLQREYPIPDLATGGELYNDLAEFGANLFLEALSLLREGKTPLPQEEEKATYSKLIDKEFTVMDWTLDGEKAAARINALAPKPGVRAKLDGAFLKLLRAKVDKGKGLPGEIISTDAGLVVATGTGAIRILEVVPEGRKPMKAADFVNSWQKDPPRKFEQGDS